MNNWYKKSQREEYLGFKIVGFDKNTKTVFSLYDKSEIELEINKVYIYSKQGLFLGTSKEYCIMYFSNIDFDNAQETELLLTFSYQQEDILTGDPLYKNGEVSVRKAKLINIDPASTYFDFEKGEYI